ncbi:sodium-coupled monocarboxylate transporter 1 [Diprion similis]|uniref:sodium-coupled monocarboxylate transporter 1 n=1 Tax=Diprion similis TaxID=362088 RepID=UPI001EF91F8D|nr:sodium-coupled monocarboxylate transporter 1 [Diprion similis]XP_046753750.1 sodium-coupled monocarboxylate transporter 1 [Diprion similis]XP_046753751.1 sodium-coupled monocarboxylate transporter 1 [Diprion similis]
MAMEASAMVVDYLVFAVCIIASFLIPLWGRFRAKKKETKADYVFATGTVSMAAMMLSIARGTLGVRSFLGYPSELYYRGSAMWETLYGMVLAYPIVCFIFVPVYYNLGITSVYQYLDMRFNSKMVRCLASFSYVIRSLLNLAVTVFTPCVALKTVIGLPYWASIVAITMIAVVFTVMGGLKAAILSDVIQGLTMIAICLAMIMQGVFDVGGVGAVVNITAERGRLDFFDFNLDPTVRVATVSAVVGQLFMSLSIFGCQQNFVQRYCSMSSQRKVTKTMMANIPVITVLFSLSWVVGMVIFASYADCDPLTRGYITKFDEILPFYVEDKFVYLPGLLGLVMATLFNSALSLAVSNLNSLATVTWEDFFSQIPALSNLKDTQQLNIIKFLSILYGFVIMGVSFLVGMLSGVIESSMLMTSATSGPLLGVFILAMLVPCANWKGAAAGMISSHVITLWITFGSLTVTKTVEMLPLSVEGCHNNSFSDHIMRPGAILNLIPQEVSTTPAATTVATIGEFASEPLDGLTYLYSITYMYYAFVGSFITVFVGTVVSLLTADDEADRYEEHLLHPLAVKFSRMLPGRKRLYASTSRLGGCSQATSNEAVQERTGKLGPNESLDANGKPELDVGYVKKLNALKGLSLDVTNEVSKSTKL